MVSIERLLRSHLAANATISRRSNSSGNRILAYREPCCKRPRSWCIVAARDMSEAAGTMGTMGRVAVVTGAASGMGLAIARHLAARGDRVGLLDLQGDAALRAAAGPARDGSHRDRRGGRRHRPRSRRRCPRQGARGARTHRDHGHQRRSRLVRALHGHHDRELGAHPRHQPHRHVPLPAGRRSRHARRPAGVGWSRSRRRARSRAPCAWRTTSRRRPA